MSDEDIEDLDLSRLDVAGPSIVEAVLRNTRSAAPTRACVRATSRAREESRERKAKEKEKEKEKKRKRPPVVVTRKKAKEDDRTGRTADRDEDAEASDTDTDAYRTELENVTLAVRELQGVMERGMSQIVELLREIRDTQQNTHRSIVTLSETTTTTHMRIEALQKKATTATVRSDPLYPSLTTVRPSAHTPVTHAETMCTDGNKARKAKKFDI